jgi:hypothetical protein
MGNAERSNVRAARCGLCLGKDDMGLGGSAQQGRGSASSEQGMTKHCMFSRDLRFPAAVARSTW